ncbi:MAG: sugar phosphate isomerase/epimerase family protein [Candidatus Merdivicinus sp.]|jgi:D-psicose/D-tagatose/L-ribulose 3-epimerase
MIKLGCCTAIPTDEDSRKRVLAIRDAGFDYVEFNFQNSAKLSADERAEAIQFLNEAGISCKAMNCFIPGDIPLVGPDADLGKARRFLDAAFPAAKEFGVESIVFGSGGARRTPPGFPAEMVRIQLIAFLRLVETYCEDYDMKIAIEPLSYVECNTLNTMMDGYWLAMDTNRPHIRLLADYYHVQRNGEDLLDLVSVGRILQHVHIANCIDRGFPSEETREEHAFFFEMLKAAKYDGTVSIEGGSSCFEKDIVEAGKILREIRGE